MDVIDSSRKFLLPLKINASIKQKFLYYEAINAQITEFSDKTYEGPGHEWDALLSNRIKWNRSPVPSIRPSLTLNRQKVAVADSLISFVERQHTLCFLDSKFPLFGFMREVPKDQKKRPKLYLWQGEADAIAYSWNLSKLVVVDFKVVDYLLDYCKKKTDLCGKHLHQCLVYAKLLQLHLDLDYLPPCLIVAIDRFTGKEGYFPLFEDYPRECYKKLDEYEWFTEQPPKHPLKIYNPEKLLNQIYPIVPDTPLQQLFSSNATVKDLLDLLGYDDIEIVPRKEQHR